MPVPTDTFWNIKRLNRVFAASAVVLLLVMGWAVIQDYDKQWREPQRKGRIWEAALVQAKLDRENNPQKNAELADLQEMIGRANATIVESSAQLEQLNKKIIDLTNRISNTDFKVNALKTDVAVMESQLENAITADDAEAVRRISANLDEPKTRLNGLVELLAEQKAEREQAREEIRERTQALDELQSQRTKFTADADAMGKKIKSLRPQGLLAKLSAEMRAMPLMGFVNPSERVSQVVLPDIQTDLGGFKRIETIDRCMTCHVNIEKKEYTQENLVAFLESSLAGNKVYQYAAIAPDKPENPDAPSLLKPGSMALAEFWHDWGRKLLSPASLAKTAGQIKSIAGVAGKLGIVYNGEPVKEFTYDVGAGFKPALPPAADDAAQRQDTILLAAIEALYKAPSEDASLRTARNNAMAYPQRLRSLLQAELPPKEYELLEDRYRRALVERVNETVRQPAGDPPLDPSPVFLAHPKLDLYVDIDSKHSFEAVGCTSCHDGSGMETNFVLAAHTPRRMWVDDRSGAPILPQQLLPLDKPVEEHQPDLSSLLEAVYPENALTPIGVSSFHLKLAEHKQEAHVQTEARPSMRELPPDHSDPMAYVDPVTGERGQAVPQGQYWAGKYEAESGTSFKDVNHYWDTPMRPAEYIQANCMRCHTDVYDIKEHAPVIYEGRSLFTNLGCVNCHQMDSIPTYENRKVGPDLRHIGEKLSEEFVHTWVWAPKAFRPSTKMPHFFMLENSSSDEELRRTRQESLAITRYLMETSTDLAPKYTPPPAPAEAEPRAASIERGREIFRGTEELKGGVGCLGCHSNLNETGQEWITTDLQQRAGLKSDEAQAAFAEMTYNQRQLYALENLGEPEGGSTAVSTYPNGKPKPIFIQHGPELSGIGTKLLAHRSQQEARTWLFNWLKEPRHYSEYTLMPQLRLTDPQAADLVEYLLDQKRTKTDPNDQWTAGKAEPDAEKLRELTALFLRSRFSPKTAYEQAANDEELTKLAVDALVSPAMPAEKAAAVVGDWDITQKQQIFLGKKLIAHYGCNSCHAINGTETMTVPGANLSDWGQKSIDKLDFAYLDAHKVHGLPPTASIPMVNGMSVEAANLAHSLPAEGWKEQISAPVEAAWPHVDHTRMAWLTQKLKNTRVYDRGKVNLEPRRQMQGAQPSFTEQGHPEVADAGKPYDKLRMPTFYLNDEQVQSIVTFVISNRDRLVSNRILAEATDETAKQIAHGRELTERFNCISCHQIEANVPSVQQYFKAEELTTKAPPSLRGEGNKIQHAWMFNFLQNVEILRPLPFIRMPSFPLTDEETTAIAAYFSTISNKESQELGGLLDPVLKYIAAQKRLSEASRSTTQPAMQPADIWPGDDWYTQPAFATAAGRLVEWALENKQINALQLDPTKNSRVELARNYRTILFKARFTADLYDTPYPFAEAPRPTMDEERFKLGESLFYEMQCLKCHVLGDPSVAGANKSPTAPNLSLTNQRLQRRWTRRWVQEPPIIQVGTAMPPFFTGLPIFDLAGQPWPLSQGVPAEQAKKVEDTYGATVEEQTDLLLDFLYAAGARGYTGVQPAAADPPAAPVEAPPLGLPPTATQPNTAGNPAVESPAGASTQNTPPATSPPIPAAPPALPQSTPGAPPQAPESSVPNSPNPPKPPPESPVSDADGKGFSIAGKVVFEGAPPEPPVIDMSGVKECHARHADDVLSPALVVNDKNQIKNVVVYVSDGLPQDGEHAPPPVPAVLDQQGCLYVPHVLTLMAGQSLVVKNSDPFLHNVHSLAQINPAFNFAQPNVDPGRNAGVLKAAEIFPVKCDVHPWMTAYIGVFDHPYFSTTAEDGSFALNALPPGQYTLTAWHEQLGTREQNVTVEEGKKLEINFTFKAR